MDNQQENLNRETKTDQPESGVAQKFQDLLKSVSFAEIKHALQKFTGQDEAQDRKQGFENWKEQGVKHHGALFDPARTVYDIHVYGISNRDAVAPYYYDQLERVTVPRDFDSLKSDPKDIEVEAVGKENRISESTFDKEVGKEAQLAHGVNIYTHGVATSAESANADAARLAISGGPVVAIDWDANPNYKIATLDYERDIVTADQSINPGPRNLAPLIDHMVQELQDTAHLKSSQIDMTGFSHGCDVTAQYLAHHHRDFPGQPLGNVVLSAPDVATQYMEANQGDIFGGINGHLFVFLNRGRFSPVPDQAVSLGAPVSDALLELHQRLHENKQPWQIDPFGLNGIRDRNDRLYHTRRQETDALGLRLGAAEPQELHVDGNNRDRVVFAEDSALWWKQGDRTKATGHFMPVGEVGATLVNNGLPESSVIFDSSAGEFVFRF